MKIVVIGGHGRIGSKIVDEARRARARRGRRRPQHRRQHAHRRGPRRGVRRRGRGGGRVQLAVLRGRRGDGLLPDVDPQHPGRRAGGPRRTPRRDVDRGQRSPPRQRLPPGQGRPGGADRGLVDPVHDRPLDAVLRVRRARSPTPPPTATPSACRRRASSPIAAEDAARAVARIAVGKPVERHRRGRRPQAVPLRRAHPLRPERARRPAPGGRRPRRAVLRDHADQRQPAARRERPARRDPVRGLARRSPPRYHAAGLADTGGPLTPPEETS